MTLHYPQMHWLLTMLIWLTLVKLEGFFFCRFALKKLKSKFFKKSPMKYFLTSRSLILIQLATFLRKKIRGTWKFDNNRNFDTVCIRVWKGNILRSFYADFEINAFFMRISDSTQIFQKSRFRRGIFQFQNRLFRMSEDRSF